MSSDVGMLFLQFNVYLGDELVMWIGIFYCGGCLVFYVFQYSYLVMVSVSVFWNRWVGCFVILDYLNIYELDFVFDSVGFMVVCVWKKLGLQLGFGGIFLWMLV